MLSSQESEEAWAPPQDHLPLRVAKAHASSFAR